VPKESRLESHYASVLQTLINIRAVTCSSAVEQKPILGYITRFCETEIYLFLHIKHVITLSPKILFPHSLFPEMLKIMRQDI